MVSRYWLLILLAGCAAPSPPPAPSPAQIAADVAAIDAAGVNPSAYYAVGSSRVRDACDAWFTAQTTAADGAHALGGLLSTAGGAAAAEPAAAVGLALGATALGAVQPAFPPAAFVLESRVMEEYAAALDVMPSSTTLAEADRRVHALAAKCSLPAIAAYQSQAAATVPVAAGPSVVQQSRRTTEAAFRHEWSAERALPTLRIGP